MARLGIVSDCTKVLHVHDDHTYSKASKVLKKSKDEKVKTVRKRKAETNSNSVLKAWFFHENVHLLLKRSGEEMKRVFTESVSEEFKECINEMVHFPERLVLTEEVYNFLDIFNAKEVVDRGTFTFKIHKLMSNDKFYEAMVVVFKDLKGFLLMEEEERYKLIQCFNRRFLNEALIRKVQLECSLVEKNSKFVRPYPLMSIKESLQKEENVVHHIGGYIAHEIILEYGYNARTFVKTSVNISDTIDDYAQWTEQLSNGRLIKLKQKAFDFMIKLNDISKGHFQAANMKIKIRVEKAFRDLENNDFIRKRWLELWGDGIASEAAKKKACQIYLNCLGKGYVGRIKTNVQIKKRASLTSISLRKEMKSQKQCTKCKDHPKVNQPKTPRVKKSPKGFMA